MNEEEILGRLKMIQEQQAKLQETLDRIENRQVQVKAEIEAVPVQGSFASSDQ